MLDIGICINSSGRAGSIRTIKQFPEAWRKFTYIIVPHEQRKEYMECYTQWNVVVMPKSVPPYLSSQRQWTIDHIPHRFIFFMDDDLKFHVRVNMKIKNSTSKDMRDMMKFIEKQVSHKVYAIGISSRVGNNRITSDYKDLGSMTQCYCFDKTVFKTLGITLAPFEPFVKQDAYFTLSWLLAGNKTRLIYKYCYTSAPFGMGGGCSRYRTFELTEKVSKYLEKKFPGFCKAELSPIRSGWPGFPKDKYGRTIRWITRCQWVKAYKHGIKSRPVKKKFW